MGNYRGFFMDFNSTFERRFWAKVKKGKGCWEWVGYRNPSGYGCLSANGRRGQMISAHRASWMLHYGPIPEGAHVLHKCDNAACVRPDHLELGNQELNMQQKMERNRCSSRVVFTKQEVALLRDAHAKGMPKTRIARLSKMDYGTLLRVLNGDYEGRDPITLITESC